jgi:hypothetical protein
MSILRADSIRDRAGTGAPDFPNGATVTGVITATSFSGAVTGNVTGNVTGTSAGLTGTPSIVVQNATVQGDLTVNGTTSTIDTVITAVDSLNVEGNVGIGTDNPGSRLHVMGDPGASGVIYLSDGDTPSVGDSFLIGKSGTTTTIKDRQTGSKIDFGTADSICLTLTSGGTAIFKAGLAEKYNAAGGTLGSNTNNSMNNGNVIEFSGNESGNLTINFTDVHATLSQGENCSFTVLIRPNGSGVINAVQIDSQSPAGGLRWSGGSLPSAGAASSYDIYTFTIFKYGTANTNYRVFGAATNYA